jgi:hypothetical protein
VLWYHLIIGDGSSPRLFVSSFVILLLFVSASVGILSHSLLFF